MKWGKYYYLSVTPPAGAVGMGWLRNTDTSPYQCDVKTSSVSVSAFCVEAIVKVLVTVTIYALFMWDVYFQVKNYYSFFSDVETRDVNPLWL